MKHNNYIKLSEREARFVYSKLCELFPDLLDSARGVSYSLFKDSAKIFINPSGKSLAKFLEWLSKNIEDFYEIHF